MRSVVKWIGIGAAVLVGLPVLLAAAILVINGWDVPLNPRAQAALDQRHDWVPAKDNVYFAIAELKPPPGADAVATTLLCGKTRGTEDCVERVHARPDAVAEIVAANQALILQYEALANYGRLEDPIRLTANSKILRWQPFLLGQQFFLAKLALSVHRGDVDTAIDGLHRDMAFHRRLLAERDLLLIDKMVLAAALRNDLLFIADLARTDAPSEAQYTGMGAFVTPLSEQERALGGVYAREFTGFADMMTAMRDGDVEGVAGAARDRALGGGKVPDTGFWNSLQMHFFKRNDTLNLQWALVEREEAAGAAPCTELAARQSEIAHSAQISYLRFLYNPVGKLLYKVAVPSADHYPMVLCDLQAMQAIVALQLSMHSRNLRGSDAADYVKGAPEALRNPYTRQPFVWDADGRTLNFAPVAERDKGYLPWPI